MENILSKLISRNKIISRLKQSDRFWHLFKGSFWLLIGMGFSRAFMMLAMIIVARILGSEQYGEFGMIRSTINTFSIFASFGIGLTANKFVAEYREKNKERVSRIISLSLIFSLCMGIIISLIILLFSDKIASYVLNSSEMTFYLNIAAIMILFSALNGAYSGIFSGLEAFKKTAVLNVITGFLSLIIIVIGTYVWGLNGAIMAFSLSLFVITIFSHFFLISELKRHKIELILNRSILKEWNILIMFSLPLALAGIVATPTHWISTALVFRMPGGKVAMGIFTACLSIQTIVYFIGNNINAPLLSLMSREKMDLKMEKINILSSWLIGIFIAMPFIMFPEISELMFGADFNGRDFRLTLVLVLFSSIIVMYKQGLQRVFLINNTIWIAFYSNLYWSIVLLVSIYFLREYGSLGLALSFFIAYIANVLLIIPYLYFKKLISKNTLLSYETMLIWFCLIFASCLQLFSINMFIRVVIAILLFVLIILLVRRIIK